MKPLSRIPKRRSMHSKSSAKRGDGQSSQANRKRRVGQEGRVGLTRTQGAAMKKAEDLGKKIVLHYPQVAADYRAGLSQRDIAVRYHLHRNTTMRVARAAIGKAIEVLIPDYDERLVLKQRAKVRAGQENGRKIYESKQEIYSLSPEQRWRASSTAGKKTRKLRIGIFGMSPETMMTARQKGLVSRGLLPWIVHLVDPTTGLNEVESLINLAAKPEFTHSKGSGEGYPIRRKLADNINAVFHQGRTVRTPLAIGRLLDRLRKEGRLPAKCAI